MPFTEFDRVFFGLRYENTTIDLTDFSPLRYVEYVRQFGSQSDALALTIGWSRDDRDNLLVPTRGRYQRAFAESVCRGWIFSTTVSLISFSSTFRSLPLLTLAFNGEIGYGDGYSGDPYPFFKNYYVGGIGSVRGFETASLGPRDLDGNPLGGNRRLNFSIEGYVPVPGADRTLRGLMFLDAGQVWGQVPRIENGQVVLVNGTPAFENEKLDLGHLRYSIGVGIAWISPLGPLKISYAYPLNTQTRRSDSAFPIPDRNRVLAACMRESFCFRGGPTDV